jgi:hypothetical protein
MTTRTFAILSTAFWLVIGFASYKQDRADDRKFASHQAQMVEEEKYMKLMNDYMICEHDDHVKFMEWYRKQIKARPGR